MIQGTREYGWDTTDAPLSAKILLGPLFQLAGNVGAGTRILDVGCGNGFFSGQFLKKGCTIVGVDMAPDGVALARKTYPGGRFEAIPAVEDVLSLLNEKPFDIVISTEVVEHVYDAHSWARACYNALRPGGKLIASTPYHGYFKNLALSVLDKWDHHTDPLRTGGHIKFWSKKTLSTLVRQHGFINERFICAGRFPGLWMDLIVGAEKPASAPSPARAS